MNERQFLCTILVLPVTDIERSAAWYDRALGFKTVYLHEGRHEGEVTNYAILEREGLEIHLILDEHPQVMSWSTAGTGYLYLKVRNVGQVFDSVRSRDVEISRGLETENWGARGFNLIDPDGNAIHVEQMQ